MPRQKDSSIVHEQISEGLKRTTAHLDNLMVVIFDFTGVPMEEPEPSHHHPHEQITYVAEGELLFFRGTDEYHLVEGDLMIIPPGIPHSIRTLSEKVRLVDSFCPLRRDFLKKK